MSRLKVTISYTVPLTNEDDSPEMELAYLTDRVKYHMPIWMPENAVISVEAVEDAKTT